MPTATQAGGLDDLAQQNTVFNSNRRERPPMMDLSIGDIASRVPLRQPKIPKKDSKGGLRGMFTRNKTEKITTSPMIAESPTFSTFSERTLKSVSEARLPRTMSMKSAAQKFDLSTPVTEIMPPTTPGQSSRMSMRSRSVKSVKTPSTKSSPRPPTRSSAAWDPPPLFQAYPQAIKHAQLTASTLSADAILRMSNHKRTDSLRDQTATPDLTSAAGKKAEKAKSKHKRQISGSLSRADWTQKIFVLVTSGYLLQYSGEGSFDRLPEKMMQLGKDSVAFASDVIPGKHWVLQISQAMDSDGTPASDTRSILSRLAFRGADYRRSATSLLLVLESAEDMDSWIAVVRREIEALGGKKHVSETGKPKPDDKVMQLRAQPSHRYLVKNEADGISSPSTPQIPSFGPPPWVKEKDDELQKQLEEATSELIRPQSSSVRPSTGHRSIAGSVTSNDGRQLESLRNSSNRFSYVSSGQRTLITSQGSSPATSPTRESASFEDALPKPSAEEPHLRPNAAAVNERRRSMQTIHIPDLEPHPTAKLHRHSTYGPPGVLNSRSPGLTPNFSVPNSSMKRYSMVKSPGPGSTPPTPSTPNRESALKGTRKGPPSALHVTRSLSPVKASPKKPLTPMIFAIPSSSSRSSSPTPDDADTRAFSLPQMVKPSIISIPPRSPGPSPFPIDLQAPPPRRMSSLTPLAPHETARTDFRLPRRYSSMQTLKDISEKQSHGLEAPVRAAPLPPPAALSTPLPSSPFTFVETSRRVSNHSQDRRASQSQRQTSSPPRPRAQSQHPPPQRRAHSPPRASRSHSDSQTQFQPQSQYQYQTATPPRQRSQSQHPHPRPQSRTQSRPHSPQPQRPQSQASHYQNQNRPQSRSRSRSRTSSHPTPTPAPMPITIPGPIPLPKPLPRSTSFPTTTTTQTPIPAIANTKTKLAALPKRPISMQISPATSHRKNPFLVPGTGKPSSPPPVSLSPRFGGGVRDGASARYVPIPVPVSSAPVLAPFSLSPISLFPSSSPSPLSQPLFNGSNTKSKSKSKLEITPNRTSRHLSPSPISKPLVSPRLQRVRDEERERERERGVGNRRSMPTLLNGPPLAPPPDCALPPLPPGGRGERERPGSVLGGRERGSV